MLNKTTDKKITSAILFKKYIRKPYRLITSYLKYDYISHVLHSKICIATYEKTLHSPSNLSSHECLDFGNVTFYCISSENINGSCTMDKKYKNKNKMLIGESIAYFLV